ncbi:MAG: hypothetical protein P9L95_10370 [Candidatus Tenebribacter mawsonii]|nr:hypothetical protein [Candidatus Tenebribacter mawsonii]
MNETYEYLELLKNGLTYRISSNEKNISDYSMIMIENIFDSNDIEKDFIEVKDRILNEIESYYISNDLFNNRKQLFSDPERLEMISNMFVHAYTHFIENHFFKILHAIKSELFEDSLADTMQMLSIPLNLYGLFLFYFCEGAACWPLIDNLLMENEEIKEYGYARYFELYMKYVIEKYNQINSISKTISTMDNTICRQAVDITGLEVKFKELEKRKYPNIHRYSINRISAGWEVVYNGKRKILQDLLGIYYFSKCLKSPDTKFLYSELANAHNLESRILDDLPFKTELNDLRKNQRSLEDELIYLKNTIEVDPTAYEVKIEKIETEINTIYNNIKQIRLSSSNTTLNDKRISDSVTKACRTAMSHCKRGYPEFYEHINSYIKWRNGKISYSCELDWF